VYSDWEDVTSSGRSLGQQPGKHGYGLPTVDRLTGGTRRVPVEQSDRLPGRLRTAVHFREEL